MNQCVTVVEQVWRRARRIGVMGRETSHRRVREDDVALLCLLRGLQHPHYLRIATKITTIPASETPHASERTTGTPNTYKGTYSTRAAI